MRSHRLYAHDPKGFLPRMSWAPQNLYSLLARSTTPALANETSFKKTSLTMYQQRWRAKRFIRGYHGDWIRERRFKRWYLPISVPRIDGGNKRASSASNVLLPPSAVASGSGSGSNAVTMAAAAAARLDERLPIASLFVRDVERRLDTVVFRACFARSAYEARTLVIHGKVKINGERIREAGRLLQPGDLISVDAGAIPMLSEALENQATARRAAELATKSDGAKRIAAERKEAEAAEAATEASEKEATIELSNESDEVASSAEASNPDAASATSSEKGKGKAREAPAATDSRAKQGASLPPGVRPFNLPPYAAPFLFIPGHLEVSFTTCSAIYMRHPTVTNAPLTRASTAGSRTPASPSSASSSVAYHTDIASPFPATGEIFSMAWEHYTRTAPRTRSDVRRQRVEARVGRQGIASARAKDEWRKQLADRRGHTKGTPSGPHGGRPTVTVSRTAAQRVPRQFVVGGGSLGKRRSGNSGTSGRSLERGQAKGKGAAPQIAVA